MTPHSVPVYERQTKPLFDVDGLALYLACSRATIYRLVQRGDLAPVRVGERLRFRAEDVERYLKRDREPSP